jgi:hypothetical protein
MGIVDDPLDLRYRDGRVWELLVGFAYEHPLVGRIVVPAGFLTDFASIPRVFWRLLPPVGRYGKAAVVHDYLYRTGCHPCSRPLADRVFLDAMRDLGVSWPVRRVMWAAVRAFGCFAYVTRA